MTRLAGSAGMRAAILREVAVVGELSPSEINARLGGDDGSLGRLSYHVRALLDDGNLEPTRTSQARGAIRHHYRISEPARQAMLDELLDVRDEINGAIRALRAAGKRAGR